MALYVCVMANNTQVEPDWQPSGSHSHQCTGQPPSNLDNRCLGIFTGPLYSRCCTWTPCPSIPSLIPDSSGSFFLFLSEWKQKPMSEDCNLINGQNNSLCNVWKSNHSSSLSLLLYAPPSLSPILIFFTVSAHPRIRGLPVCESATVTSSITIITSLKPENPKSEFTSIDSCELRLLTLTFSNWIMVRRLDGLFMWI